MLLFSSLSGYQDSNLGPPAPNAEYDIFDNLEVVGKDFIWQMYRDSPALIWRTAFLNERLFKIANGFYSALDEHHFYIPKDTGNLKQQQQTNWHELSNTTCIHDDDLDWKQPLYIACDANSSISTLCVAQISPQKELKTVKSFFVKTPRKLQDVAQDFCKYYAPLIKKRVVFYYDHTFTWTSGTSNDSYADTIISVLKKTSTMWKTCISDNQQDTTGSTYK